jgi:hypothetical protein
VWDRSTRFFYLVFLSGCLKCYVCRCKVACLCLYYRSWASGKVISASFESECAFFLQIVCRSWLWKKWGRKGCRMRLLLSFPRTLQPVPMRMKWESVLCLVLFPFDSLQRYANLFFFFLLKTFRRISIHQVLIMQLTNSWIPEWISSNFVAWCWNRWRTMKRLIMLRQSTRTCPVLWIFFSVISMLESSDYSKALEHDFSLNLSGPRFRQYASVKKGLTHDFRYPYVSWRSLQQLACQPSSLLALHAWVFSEVSFHSPKYNQIIKTTHERCCTVRLA